MQWLLDERPVDADDGWRANVALHGYDKANVRFPERQLRGATQDSRLRAILGNGEEVWSGRLAADPYVSGGIAELAASGYLDRLRRNAGRLLYQSRDIGLWSDAKEAPYQLGGSDAVAVSTEFSSLNFIVVNSTTNAAHALCFWAPGTPGGLTRIAFDWTSSTGTLPTGSALHIKRFDGPSGTRTVVTSLTGTPATAQDIDLGTAKQDAIMVEFEVGSTAVGPDFVLRLANTRVNGIIPATGTPGGDTFRVTDVVKDVFARVGYDYTEVAASRLNPLPLDWTGTWEGLLDYCEALQGDHHYFINGESAIGPRGSFTQWQDVWQSSLASDAIAQLPPLSISNRVIVNYTDVGSTAPRQVTVDADPNPLGPGEISSIVFDLPDMQKDSTFAGLLGANLVEQVSIPRRAGTLDTISARKRDDPTASVYQIRPGALIRITDWGSGISLDVPVAEVELSSRGVRLGIERTVSVATLLARNALNQLGVGIFFTFGRNATLPPWPGTGKPVPMGGYAGLIGRDRSGRQGGGATSGMAPGSGFTIPPPQPLSIT